MNRAGRRLLAGLSALLLCLNLCACGDGPEPEEPTPPEETPAVAVPELPQREESAYDDVRVYYDGLLMDRGYCANGAVYLDPALMCQKLDLELENTADEEQFCIRISGLSLTGEREKDYFTADYRYLFAPYHWLTLDGRALLSTDVFERVFSVGITVSEDQKRVDVDTVDARLLKCGQTYYFDMYSEEDIFWLSRIINAEATNQPLAGQIGVANVVLNRVAYPYFPNTIHDVIFQKDEGFQFTPVENGAINRYPGEQALIAAYLALDGYNTVGDCMFFVNPTTGNPSWFKKWKTYVITIGDHDFYA